jgi:hypothetical protein
LIVDEAHHLNADEEAGPTQGYKLVQRLVEENRVTSIVFFTGTPHRGKDFGFLSLLRLLRQDFDPRRPMREQLDLLASVMIRNNKQNVTDLHGRRLFQSPMVRSETYGYSAAEERFYRTLTEFIATGKAYASSLVGSNGRAVMLVLITMQKLASSSVAAIRRALRRRLARSTEARRKLETLEARRAASGDAIVVRYTEAEGAGENDLISVIEEEMAELAADLPLMRNEEPRLRELVALAEEVTEETKIQKIIEIISARFADRRVLLFTEYKATQAAVMSALMRRFGDGCVTFINGDDAVEDVVLPSGESVKRQGSREEAATAFNGGRVRFLVSTEAGGEGIDLQESCHSLIHVDLPWNPMRLHQRVGRLNRHGQRERVEVVSLRNPSTVEALIWDKLNAKLDRVMLALRQVMEEPEDLLQLVLGMTSPALFREMFAEAPTMAPESLSRWFDERTGRLGGKDAVDAVRDLVGNCAKFDFQAASDQLPRVDLPALRPFFLSMLAINGRRPREEDGRLSFRTPDLWMDEVGVSESYEGLTFTRETGRGQGPQKVMGVGHKAFDRSLRQAKEDEACVASVRTASLPRPLVILRVRDRVTSEHRTVRGVVVGVELDSMASLQPRECLADWQLIGPLNELVRARGVRARTSRPTAAPSTALAAIEASRAFIGSRSERLGVAFRQPSVEAIAVLWPNVAGEGSLSEPSEDEEMVGTEEEVGS